MNQDEEGTAWVRDRNSHELNGSVRENQTSLRRHFGIHLVSLEDGALEASDGVQREQQEEKKQRSNIYRPMMW